MRLFEFEAKNILKKYGILVPEGEVVSIHEDAERIAVKLGKPVVLKSQVLVTGRGKAGGIKFASDPDEAGKTALNMLGGVIKGLLVERVLIEQKLEVTEELYASVAVDRNIGKYVVLASTEGGVDIEEVAEKSPARIARHSVDPVYGFNEFDARKMVKKLGLGGDDLKKFSYVITQLYRAAVDYDAELAEINPLVKTSTGDFVAADARMIIDDNALFRHPEFKERETARPEDTILEAEARKHGLSYVDLPGNIGVLGNGAGLVMATLDLIQLYGGNPANFLDVGGGARAETVKRGVKLILCKPDVKVILVNILGGITRCDEVAKGIIEALKESTVEKTVVIRMIGTKEEEGRRILQESGIHVYSSMEEVAQGALNFLKG